MDQCKMKNRIRILQSNGLFSGRNNNDHENITTIIMPLDTNKLRAGFYCNWRVVTATVFKKYST